MEQPQSDNRLAGEARDDRRTPIERGDPRHEQTDTEQHEYTRDRTVQHTAAIPSGPHGEAHRKRSRPQREAAGQCVLQPLVRHAPRRRLQQHDRQPDQARHQSELLTARHRFAEWLIGVGLSQPQPAFQPRGQHRRTNRQQEAESARIEQPPFDCGLR